MADPDFLQNVELFTDLDEEQLQLIEGLLKEGTYKTGERMIEEGIVGVSLFIIVSGAVKVFLSFGAESVELTRLGPGDFFGEMSLIDDHSAVATVEAVEDTSVLILSRPDFKALLSNSTELSSKMWESISRNLNAKIRKTDELVKAYYGLNKALCEDPKFREFFSLWNFSRRDLKTPK